MWTVRTENVFVFLNFALLLLKIKKSIRNISCFMLFAAATVNCYASWLKINNGRHSKKSSFSFYSQKCLLFELQQFSFSAQQYLLNLAADLFAFLIFFFVKKKLHSWPFRLLNDFIVHATKELSNLIKLCWFYTFYSQNKTLSIFLR